MNHFNFGKIVSIKNNVFQNNKKLMMHESIDQSLEWSWEF